MSVTAKEAAHALAARSKAARDAEERRAAELRGLTEEIVRTSLSGIGARAWLIGSLAWGGFGVRSDVDVVVEGLTPGQATELELALVARLKVPVDLLRIEELPEPFRARVLEEGIPVHA